ncbi:MAG: cytochrome c [Saprospiraceae bacterium]|nr:cytochrome c [Saprospiraceae bacterium]
MKPIEIAKYLAPVLLAVIVMVTCKRDYSKPGREYAPDMAHSKAYETYTKVKDNTAFEDGYTALEPAKGSIARGQKVYHGDDTPEGYTLATASDENPLALTDEALARGKEVYSIYCTPCHGPKGDGEGTAVLGSNYNLAAPPINFTAPTGEWTSGRIFHVINYGKGNMGAYASQIAYDDRWRLVHYVKSLNNANTATTADGSQTASK